MSAQNEPFKWRTQYRTDFNETKVSPCDPLVKKFCFKLLKASNFLTIYPEIALMTKILLKATLKLFFLFSNWRKNQF